MNSFFKFLIILLIILGITTACSTIKDPELISISNLEIKTDSESFNIQTDLKIYNPNKFTLRSQNINIELFINDLFIGDAVLLEKFNVKKQDTSVLTFNLNLDSKFFNQRINLGDTLNLNIKGKAKIFFNLNYKFNTDYQLSLSDLFESLLETNFKNSNINLNSVRIENIGFSNFDILPNLTFKNNFDFDYSIEKLNIEIYDSDKYNIPIGVFEKYNSIQVKKQSHINIESPISINTAKFGKSILKNLSGKTYSLFVKINAKVVFKKIELPLTVFKKLEYDIPSQKIYIK
jgi:LEA14-like dessication related protein